jgi:hypothetical protein
MKSPAESRARVSKFRATSIDDKPTGDEGGNDERGIWPCQGLFGFQSAPWEGFQIGAEGKTRVERNGVGLTSPQKYAFLKGLWRARRDSNSRPSEF